jgi:hypothetical protein
MTPADLKGRVKGEVILPGDTTYDEARTIWNAMIDKRPAVIARCTGTADVAAAVNFARDSGMVLAVRGGGHNIAGSALCDGGIVIDLSRMKAATVDPAARRVTVEGGATLGDLDAATQAHGLATPVGINSTTGVAGLTLGGGFGWLSRKYGMTIDNLESAEVVTAAGQVVRASATENPDLFWALRGGGGNFGVVTSFLFQAHPVRDVFAGPIFWDAQDALTVMRTYRDFIRAAPEELGIFVGLKTVPPMDPFPQPHWGKRACAIIGAYNGTPEAGAKAMAPLLSTLPEPLFNWMGPMPFPAINSLFDPFFPKGLQWYWKGDFVSTLPDEAIKVYIEQSGSPASDFCLMHLYPIDGAVHRVAKDATAWQARDAAFNMVIAAIDPDPKNAGKLKAWGRAYWKAVHPFNQGGAYVNFLYDDEAEGRLEATYGENYARLGAIKAKYDPKNLFRVNQNIKPRP